MAGLFITFEGVECSGKSLQSKLLNNYCLQHEIPVIMVREPGGTPTGEALRNILLHQDCTSLTEFFILSASRTYLSDTVIKPHLAKDFVVISDRYFHSSLAYQAYGRGLDMTTLKDISLIATQGLEPDICFLLNPHFDTAQTRLQSKKHIQDRIEQETRDFHEKVYLGYQQIAKDFSYIHMIDGEQSPEIIHQHIVKQLKALNSFF